MRFAFALVALLAVPYAHPAAAQPDAEGGFRPVMTGDATDSAARGIWRYAPAGWLLEIDESGIRRWQETPAGCYATREAAEWAPFMGQIEYPFFAPAADGSTAGFRYLEGDAVARFERIDALPADCVEGGLSGSLGTFEAFASIMARHYAFFEERGIDWHARVESVRPSIVPSMSEPALFDALSGLIEGLGDSHTKLIAEIDGEVRRQQDGLGETLPTIGETVGQSAWLQGIVGALLGDILDPGARHVGNERIVWGTLDDARIGYVQIFTMGGFSAGVEPGTQQWADAERAAFAAIMEEAIGAFGTAEVEAVIVDLSNNRGGYDAIARDIAARFADAPFLAYRVDEYGFPDLTRSYAIAPATGARFLGPVYVLTSDVTVSGGEIATLSLRGLPNVTHVGGTTRGSFSTPLAKPLPNGWYLELSNEIFSAPDGTVFEEIGIAPDIVLPVYPREDPIAGHGTALRAIAAMNARND